MLSSCAGDGDVRPVREAVEEFWPTDCGTVLSGVAGRVAYYHGEDPEERYLLMRK